MGERYRREIEEILKQVGEPPGPEKAPEKGGSASRGIRGWLGPGFGGRLWRLSSGKVFLASIALLIGALVMRSVAPGLVGLLAWGGVVLFIAAYAMFFIRPGPALEKRWRGRLVEESPESLRGRLRRWWRR